MYKKIGKLRVNVFLDFDDRLNWIFYGQVIVVEKIKYRVKDEIME